MKNNEQLLKTIGEINEKYISKNNIKRRRPTALKLTAGLSLCAAAAAGFFVLQNTFFLRNDWSRYPVFPAPSYDTSDVISITPSDIHENIYGRIPCRISDNGLYGYVSIPDTVQATDISVLKENNPWSENTELSSLPVFRNLSHVGGDAENPTYFLSDNQMTTAAENTAKMLGVTITENEFTELGAPEQNYRCRYALRARCTAEKFGLEGLWITVYSDGAVEIDFVAYDLNENGAYVLPAEYSGDSENSDSEQARALTEYLAEEFKNVLQFENPQDMGFVLLQYPSDNGTVTNDRVFRIYDKTDSGTRNIVNYSLAFADFDVRNGKLYRITLTNRLCVSDYIGDYPIISLSEAESLLAKGVYTTNVLDIELDKNISAEDAESAELVYVGDNSEYYMPFYRFYVKLRKPAFLEDTAIELYGAFYVPAVELEYIDMGFELPDLSGEALDAYPNDKVKLPHRFEEDKTEAYKVYYRDGEPVLEFDFAVLRSPNKFFQNTIDDPSCFDFETMTFSGERPIYDEVGYTNMRKGDPAKGGFTVIEARMLVMWDKENNTEKYLSNYVRLYRETGYVNVEGILRYFPEDNDWAKAGDLYFYPDPSGENSLDVSFYNVYGDSYPTISFVDGNTAVRTDGGVINAGNAADLKCIGFDPEEIFKDGNCVKMSLGIKELVYEDYDEENKGVFADFVSWEPLPPDSEE